MIKKHYVEFFYSGDLYNETFSEEIKSRDPEKVKVPDGIFGFQFFDIVSDKVEIDDEKIELSSEHLNISPMYYYGGCIYTEAEVVATVPNNEIILRYMQENGWKKVIKIRTGNFQRFDEKEDIFIKEK